MHHDPRRNPLAPVIWGCIGWLLIIGTVGAAFGFYAILSN